MKRAFVGSSDSIWWVVGALAGPIAVLIPNLLATDETPQIKFLLSCCSLFVLGGVLGCLAPHRPWRWAIACVLLLPCADALMEMPENGSLTFQELLDSVLATAENAAKYLLQALAALVGAYVGAFTGAGR